MERFTMRGGCGAGVFSVARCEGGGEVAADQDHSRPDAFLKKSKAEDWAPLLSGMPRGTTNGVEMDDVNRAVAKRKLGVPNWRNSKDKVLKAVAAMPEMATEVRLKVIEQFPAFKELGKADIAAVTEAHKSTLAANENSQNHFFKASQDQRDALQTDLARDELTWEQREALHDRLDRNVLRVSEKDSENKRFNGAAMKLAVTASAAALGLSVAFVHGRIVDAGEGSSEETQ
ncbi:hypothetical protein [Streptomyces sp. BH055]|uniref:hypothetical protein n=1 Tax=unclassified Streptomyces TaxID=2593676 RepID=UPI003BB71C3D